MLRHWLPILRVRPPQWFGEPLAALISLDTLRNLLGTLGYPAVSIFVMIESSGIPFPGETMLLLASFYAAVDPTLNLQIPIVIACAALGAIVGDNIGFYVGRTGGRAFVMRFGRYLFLKPSHLERAEKFFARHGDKTVFFGRFIAVLRAWAAFLAGVNHMRWRTFLIYNAAGGIVWATIFGLLGFYAGRVFHDNFTAVEHLARNLSWGGAAILIVVALTIFLLYYIRRKRRAASEAHASSSPAASSEYKDEPEASPVSTEVVNPIAAKDQSVQTDVITSAQSQSSEQL